MDKQIEELNSKSRIDRLKRKFELAKLYGSDQLTVPMPDLDALLAKLEAAEQRVEEMTEQYLDRNTALTFVTLRAEAAETRLLVPENWISTLETAAKLIDLCRTYVTLHGGSNYKERTISDCELTMQEVETYVNAIKAAGFKVEGE